MNDVGLMKGLKSTQELLDDENDLVHGEAWLPKHVLFQCAQFEALEDELHELVDLHWIDNFYQAWVLDTPIDIVVCAPFEVNTVDNFDAHLRSSMSISGFEKLVVTRIFVRLNEPGELIRFRELRAGNVDVLNLICPYDTILSASHTRFCAHAHF